MEKQEDSRRTLGPAGPGYGAVRSIAFGDPRRPTWRPKALLGAQLGGSKRSEELNLEAQSGPRRQLGSLKPVLELNLEVLVFSEGLSASEKPCKNNGFPVFLLVFHNIAKVHPKTFCN